MTPRTMFYVDPDAWAYRSLASYHKRWESAVPVGRRPFFFLREVATPELPAGRCRCLLDDEGKVVYVWSGEPMEEWS